MEINWQITKKQHAFITSQADEVLYGGAAGGGKSYSQLIDSFLKAQQYPGIRQLILRRTFPELKRSLILVSMTLFPRESCKYSESNKTYTFPKGSVIEFGYCDSEGDVQQYQSAEYDIIRFDELTHFTEFQYTYMISRIRGANTFPKQLKSSTNPGSVGHSWVKKRFIENKQPQTIFTDDTGRSFTFIPAKVQENRFLMQADPGYVNRLRQLGEAEQKALLDGDWDIFKGQYFPEFDREIHVCRPIELPAHWPRFRSLDYGLDMCSCGWWAADTEGRIYRYRELHEPSLTLSQAAAKILAMTPEDEEIRYTVASPDLWNRRQETGVSGQETMYNAGLKDLIKADAHRINGWRTLREYLAAYDREGELTADLVIFDTCVHAITCLPALIHDTLKVEDASGEPHDITHAPEEIRYAVMSRPRKAKHDKPEQTKVQAHKARLLAKGKPNRVYR